MTWQDWRLRVLRSPQRSSVIREVVWKAHETSVEHFWKTLLDLLLDKDTGYPFYCLIRIQDTHNGLSIKTNPYPFNPVIFAICHPTWHCHRHPQTLIDPTHLRSKPRLWWYWVEPWSGWDLWRHGFRILENLDGGPKVLRIPRAQHPSVALLEPHSPDCTMVSSQGLDQITGLRFR